MIGSVTSCFNGPALAVGASGALFGLLGGLGVIQLRFKDTLPLSFQQSRKWWVIVLGLNALLPMFIESIDWCAHVGGFVGGVIATWLMLIGHKEIPLTKPGPVCSIFAAVCIAAFGFSVAGAVAHALGGSDFKLEFLQSLAESRLAKPITRNNAAWDVAISSKNREHLLIARVLSKQALRDAEPGQRLMFLDTLAKVEFELGDFGQAVRFEQEVVDGHCAGHDEYVKRLQMYQRALKQSGAHRKNPP